MQPTTGEIIADETPEAFRARVEARLTAAPSPVVVASPATVDMASRAAGPSDFDLNPGLERELLPADPPRPAAVLIPVIARQPLTVLLTLRTAHLAKHAGQVAFPGGKIDDDDESATATALREAEEEIALDPRLVEPLGFLDTYRTSTGFAVAPLVALVAPDYHARPNPHEVADVFEVPLAFLMDPANIALNARMWMGRERQFYAYTYRSHYIWGATAGILNNMHARLYRR